MDAGWQGPRLLAPWELPWLKLYRSGLSSVLCHCFAFQGSDDEEEGQKVPPPPETPMPPPLPPTPDQVIVRKDYDPKGEACLPGLVLLKKVLHFSDGLFLGGLEMTPMLQALQQETQCSHLQFWGPGIRMELNGCFQ